MTKRLSVRLLTVFAIGALAGATYDWLSWKYHLVYFGLNWLGPLVGADGEHGYDAMTCEAMIDFGTVCILLYLAVQAWLRRRLSLRVMDRYEAP